MEGLRFGDLEFVQLEYVAEMGPRQKKIDLPNNPQNKYECGSL